MSIVSCEHHSGMGLCSACARETEASVRRTSAALQRQKELQQAIDIARRYGCWEAANELARKASERQ